MAADEANQTNQPGGERLDGPSAQERRICQFGFARHEPGLDALRLTEEGSDGFLGQDAHDSLRRLWSGQVVLRQPFALCSEPGAPQASQTCPDRCSAAEMIASPRSGRSPCQ